ncbi:hypothetical protein QP157_00830 [Sphingomonas sp. LR61]|uniref:hypothetical protein n=1 Tax=Sphingomonas sp. LR61 TaxID=3050234 RepID=UPI002FE02D54
MTTSARTLLGVTLVDGGANVALFSSTAERVEFCTFDDDGNEHRTELQHRTGYTFHEIVPGVAVGTRYGFRVHGAWDPARACATTAPSSCSTRTPRRSTARTSGARPCSATT